MTKKQKKGFTLIELLVVVAIIGLLAAIAVIALNNARARARDAKRLADIRQIQTALEMYFLDQNHYPNYDGSSGIGGKYLCSTEAGFEDTACSETTYMAKVPSNPSPQNDGDCTSTDYTYAVAVDYNTTYEIRYCLGQPTGGISAGVHVATPAGIADP